MGAFACLADNVTCDCAASISLGSKSTVSQNSLLSTASYESDSDRLVPVIHPILIENQAWIASGVFVGPGVRIGKGAVVGACAVVLADIEPWAIVGGNPLRFIKERVMRGERAGTSDKVSPSFG